ISDAFLKPLHLSYSPIAWTYDDEANKLSAAGRNPDADNPEVILRISFSRSAFFCVQVSLASLYKSIMYRSDNIFFRLSKYASFSLTDLLYKAPAASFCLRSFPKEKTSHSAMTEPKVLAAVELPSNSTAGPLTLKKPACGKNAPALPS